MSSNHNFTAGDTVAWTSQSGGYTRTKVGIVEEVVPAKGLPSRDRFPQLYRNAGVGLPRDHVSFVVRVPGKTAKAAGTLYWPRVSGLIKPDILPLPDQRIRDDGQLSPWQDGSKKPAIEGKYLRQFEEGDATSDFNRGEWLRDGFFASDIQDAPWRGLVVLNQAR